MKEGMLLVSFITACKVLTICAAKSYCVDSKEKGLKNSLVDEMSITVLISKLSGRFLISNKRPPRCIKFY